MGLLRADTPRDTAVAWLFVLVQLGLLVAIILLPPGDAWPVPPWLAAVGLVLELVGVVVLLVGLLNLGRSVTPLPTPVPYGELQVGGLYRWVRHPVYAGIIALVVGATLRSGSAWVALASAALIGWFSLKARWEERHLAARYPGYAAYAARTPRFVPGWPTGPAPEEPGADGPDAGGPGAVDPGAVDPGAVDPGAVDPDDGLTPGA